MTDLETWVLASHNAGKIKELGSLLEPYGVKLRSAADFSLPEPEETEHTFQGNAALKAEAACKATGLPALADDSGLCVDALNGQPGVHSARWAGPERDFLKAMQSVEDELVRSGSNDRSAAFVCVLALARPGADTVFYEGRIDGRLVWPPRGVGGFGYDPVFQPEGETRVFAEMDPEDKRALSHRGRALDALIRAEFSQ